MEGPRSGGTALLITVTPTPGGAIAFSRIIKWAMCSQNLEEGHRQAYLPGVGVTVISKAVPPERGPSIALQEGHRQAYLPGVGVTVISKAVPPERGPSIALRSG
ncbi:hypothetical protein QE152_g22843 [Popillia japonica]|uniref:Uncharacterized protein n=1 Tax=Popillia japonica TaxID=7064 RepID=A0AAW1KJB2_POPJA